MKRIIKLLSITVLLGSLLMIYSCSEEFLTKEPPGVAAGSVMQTPEGVEALLIGTYERMQNGDSMFGGALASEWTYSGGCSDDATKEHLQVTRVISTCLRGMKPFQTILI